MKKILFLLIAVPFLGISQSNRGLNNTSDASTLLLKTGASADTANLKAKTFLAVGTGANKLPVGTTAQRPASPTRGDIRYNRTTRKVEISRVDGSFEPLHALKDTMGASNGQVLAWNVSTGTWEPTSSGISGTAGQSAFFTASNAVGGTNEYWWDIVNKRLGIHTTTPAVRLDVHANPFVTPNWVGFAPVGPAMFISETENSSSGGSVLNAPQTALILGRSGINGAVYSTTVQFMVGKFRTGGDGAAQLNIRMNNGTDTDFLDGATFRADGTNGLNNTAPETVLDIKQSVSATSYLGDNKQGLRVRNPQGNGHYSFIQFMGAQAKPIGQIATLEDTGAGGTVVISSSNNFGTGITNVGVAVDPGGNVGVNTLTPGQDFDVNGKVRVGDVSGITPTTISGRNASGDIGTVALGTGLAITSGTLNYTLPSSLGGIYGGDGATPTGGSIVTVTDAKRLIFTSTESSGNQVRFNMTQGSGVQWNNNSGTQLNRTYSTSSAFVNESVTRQQTTQGLTSVNLIATDGSKTALFTVRDSGYVTLPTFTNFPAVTGDNKTGWNSTTKQIQYMANSAVKTVANVQDDFKGSAFTIRTADFTAEADIFTQIIDANAGAVVVTIGNDLKEGYDYLYKCRRNNTNTITFTADGSNVLDVDGLSTIGGTSLVCGAAGTGIQAPYKIIHVRKSGGNLFVR